MATIRFVYGPWGGIDRDWDSLLPTERLVPKTLEVPTDDMKTATYRYFHTIKPRGSDPYPIHVFRYEAYSNFPTEGDK